MTDGSLDFHIWYSSDSPHPKAVEAYLSALFRYFELLASSTQSSLGYGIDDWPISFSLRHLNGDLMIAQMASGSVSDFEVFTPAAEKVSTPEAQTTLLGVPDGASVISANKDVGFGRTASQEEMVVGASPEMCIVVLLAPTLADADVIVVQGCQAMISMKGYARDAELAECRDGDEHQTGGFGWRSRSVLFMDALELDSYDLSSTTPDLLPGNMDRELQKAYTAFSARNNHGSAFKNIVTGLWGCRSLGGNRYIKTIIQWAAASMAGVKLRLICSGEEQQGFAHQLRRFADIGMRDRWTVDFMLSFLRKLVTHDEAAKNVFDTILPES